MAMVRESRVLGALSDASRSRSKFLSLLIIMRDLTTKEQQNKMFWNSLITTFHSYKEENNEQCFLYASNDPDGKRCD